MARGGVFSRTHKAWMSCGAVERLLYSTTTHGAKGGLRAGAKKVEDT